MTSTKTAAQNPHHALKGDLTTGRVPVLLVKLTIPMIWGLLAMISFQLADMYFLSRLGPSQLIAVGFTFPVTMVLLSLMIAMGIATSSIVSRAIGGGNRDEVQRLSTHAVIITAMAGLLITALGLMTIDPVFRAMGAGPEILPLIHAFMTIIYCGTVFQAVMTVGNFIMRAGGDAVFPALILIAAALVNLVLDPVLIFGLWGFPRMEMEGAALANVISYLVAMLISLYILIRHKNAIARAHMNFVRFGDSLKRFLVIALPVGIANIVQPVTNGIVTGILAQNGAAAVAAYGIAARIEAFAFIVIMALASAMGPMVGQNWGAGLHGRVNQALKAAFGFVFLWSICVAAFLALASRQVAEMFTANADIIRDTMLYFWIVPASYAFGNLVNGWGSAFNAMGLPKNAFMLVIVRTLVITLPFAWIGHYLAGVSGIFCGIAAANIVCGLGISLVSWRILRELEQESTIKTL